MTPDFLGREGGKLPKRLMSRNRQHVVPRTRSQRTSDVAAAAVECGPECGEAEPEAIGLGLSLDTPNFTARSRAWLPTSYSSRRGRGRPFQNPGSSGAVSCSGPARRPSYCRRPDFSFSYHPERRTARRSMDVVLAFDGRCASCAEASRPVRASLHRHVVLARVVAVLRPT